MTMQKPDITKLVSWWRMEENGGTAYDSHGNYHLTQHSGTVTRGNGKKGYCRNFERDTTHYLTGGGGTVVVSTSFSYGLWIKPESFAGAMTLFHQENAVRLRINATTKLLEYSISEQESLNSGFQEWSSIYWGSPLLASTWYWIACTYDASTQEFKLRVNDGAAVVGGLLYNDGANQGEMYWGANNTPGEYFDGKMDEAVWMGGALTDDENAWFYNNGLGRTYYDLNSQSFMTMF